MTSHETFLLHFAAGESASQEVVRDADALEQVARRMDTTLSGLVDRGLQGAFLASFEHRLAELLNTLRLLTDEIAQTGRDLQAVVERARLLDSQTALRWMQGSEVSLPESGSVPGRLAHIGTSITRLETLQVALRAQLADVQRQKSNPVNALLGLRDDYEAMEAQLEETLARNTARVDQLRLEQAQLEQAAPEGTSAFGQLLREHEQADSGGLSGFGQVIREHEQAVTRSYATFVHSQYDTQDTYGCALYAQSSALEAMGFNFSDTLAAAKQQGIADGWYDTTTADGDGVGMEYQGLGAVFAANGIPYERMGADKSWSGTNNPDGDGALTRLQTELQQGRFPVVSILASDMPYYQKGIPSGHTVWVTGVATDTTGQVTGIIANDSHFGRQVTLPIDQFMRGWSKYNYQAVFARRP